MDQNIAQKLRESIKRHESFRPYPYLDTKGNLTIGYGRNLTLNRISETEGEILLGNDIINATAELYRFIPWTQDLEDARKAILIEMTFNMGIEKLLQFKKMLEAIQNKDYELASQEMLNSTWHEEVGNRADDLAYAMQKGTL
jgi:lysozyme